MPKADKPHILLTNDDGIPSRGLWAAAEALADLGWVTVAAPREQFSGAGRSMPLDSDGIITEEQVTVHGKVWTVYAVGGSPAQTVQHAILEIVDQPPDLVVSGINHGENLTVSITISGTIGAALEAASFGVPALAVSLELPKEKHHQHTDADFGAAAHFTRYFADRMLTGPSFADFDVLKVDVPTAATAETAWRVTRLSRSSYYLPQRPDRQDLRESIRIGYEVIYDERQLEPDSDVYAVRVDRVVAVTPLSLDMTSRIDLQQFERELRGNHRGGRG
jgi:5'-nucleotidase